jgi:hypothetical protein
VTGRHYVEDFDRNACRCGSGLHKYDLTDARGIFCTYVCDKCEATRRAEFSPEIFRDSQYHADEPIESEDY